MDIKLLEPGFSICHVIYPSDMKALKAQGFTDAEINAF